MTAPPAAPRFVDSLRFSGLLAPEAIDDALSRHAAAADDARALADGLVRDGLLTAFQAGLLLRGRHKDFVLKDKYKLLDLLGTGGMGRVFLCEHVRLRRLVAVKVLVRSRLADAAAVERFYREARVIAALDHPNVVRIYDVEPDPAMPLMVMEYVPGNSLQGIVSRGGPLSVARACHYAAQAASGLQYAHLAGLVHRDIKPGNLLLDPQGVVKILDLGLARFFNRKGDDITARLDDNAVMGTADYLAPEQAMGEAVDIRADLYALGGTLYFLLTGRPPFADMLVAQKLVAHQMSDPEPLSAFRGDVPAGVAELVSRLMAKSPHGRPATPQEVVEALAPWTAEPIGPPAEWELRREPAGGISTTRHAATLDEDRPRSVLSSTRIRAAEPPPPRRRRSRAVPFAAAVGLACVAAVGLAWLVTRPGPQPETPSGSPAVTASKTAEPLDPRPAILPAERAYLYLNSPLEQTVELEAVGTGYDNRSGLLFLNSQLDRSTPLCFTVVIAKDAAGGPPLDKPFEELGAFLKGKTLRVTGRVVDYNGNRRPQIQVKHSSQVAIVVP